MIKSVYEKGYWWIEVDDRSWSEATMMDYIQGTPIYVRR